MSTEEHSKQEQHVDIHVDGNVQGDVHIDRHDSQVDQSVKGVTAKGDAIIATGNARIMRITGLIPSWVWVVILVGSLGGLLGFYLWRYLKIEALKRDLRFQPSKGELGILVGNFRPISGIRDEAAEGQRFAEKISSELQLQIKALKDEGSKPTFVVKPIRSEIKQYFTQSSEAEEFAKTYEATLIIWGDIDLKEGEIVYTIQPVKRPQERYQLASVDNIVNLDRGLESRKLRTRAESVEQEVEKFLFFTLGFLYYMEANDQESFDKSITFFERARASPRKTKQALCFLALNFDGR
jgi:hypothetical protein